MDTHWILVMSVLIVSFVRALWLGKNKSLGVRHLNTINRSTLVTPSTADVLYHPDLQKLREVTQPTAGRN